MSHAKQMMTNRAVLTGDAVPSKTMGRFMASPKPLGLAELFGVSVEWWLCTFGFPAFVFFRGCLQQAAEIVRRVLAVICDENP